MSAFPCRTSSLFAHLCVWLSECIRPLLNSRGLFKRPSLQPTKLHSTLSSSISVVGHDSSGHYYYPLHAQARSSNRFYSSGIANRVDAMQRQGLSSARRAERHETGVRMDQGVTCQTFLLQKDRALRDFSSATARFDGNRSLQIHLDSVQMTSSASALRTAPTKVLLCHSPRFPRLDLVDNTCQLQNLSRWHFQCTARSCFQELAMPMTSKACSYRLP